MNWPLELLKLYEKHKEKAGTYTTVDNRKVPFLPLFHDTVNAVYEIVLTENGELSEIKDVPPDDAVTIVPVYVAFRTSDCCPNALCDNVKYIASTSKYHHAYMEKLKLWHDSDYSHPTVDAVYSYLSKETVEADLEYFESQKPKKRKNNNVNEKEKKLVKTGSFIRFTILYQSPEKKESHCWLDRTLHKQFISYHNSLLYHFRAFSADVTRENIAGVSDYKYATVLLPNEYVAYTHLPRVSEGGIDTNIDDVPKFRVPGLMRGNIYMGTQLNSERYTFKSGYRTQFDYRINIDELMHGVFTGASRSGKTVAAMRFIRELANSRRTATGKRLRIVIMDPKQDWRGIARFVEPERFRFYSLGNTHFHPISLNPCKIPYGVEPQHWIDGIINIYCRAYGLLERGKQMLSDVFYELYTEAGVFPANGESFDEEYMAQFDDWKAEISKRSAKVTFHKLYKKMDHKNKEFSGGGKRAGNDTLDAYSRLLERLSCFARAYSIEYRLFSQEDRFEDINSTGLGLAVDELIGADDVTVFESFGLESTFANFIFGIITSGFYKFAKGFERGYLNPSQYETVLVIEEANKVLTGNDTAGTGSSGMASLSGQSEFEEILDQSAGYGLFIIAITQKISMMPSSIVANCGMFFLGKISQPEDVDLAVRMIGREGRIDDRDVVKWLPKSPTGWFICRSNRGYDFRDAEPVLVQIEPLNNATISNAELDEILTKRNIVRTLAENTAKIRRAAAG